MRRGPVVRLRIDEQEAGFTHAPAMMDVSSVGVPITFGLNSYTSSQIQDGEVFDLVAVAGPLTEQGITLIEAYLHDRATPATP